MLEQFTVKYGMYNLCEEREMARASFGYIMSDFKDLKDKYIKLGFHLDEFNRFMYYKDFGYLTFEEFCINNIPLDLSSISRCISVFQIFAEFDKKSRVRKMWLDDKYKDFSYSQLVEMVSLDGDIREMIKSDLTVKQIREVKKYAKENKDCGIYERRDKVKNFINNGCKKSLIEIIELDATSQVDIEENVVDVSDFKKIKRSDLRLCVDENMSDVFRGMMDLLEKYDNVFNVSCCNKNLHFSTSDRKEGVKSYIVKLEEF